MSKTVLLVFVVIFGIFTCGCTSYTQPGQTNQTIQNTPIPQSTTSIAPTIVPTNNGGTPTTPYIPVTTVISTSGKDQYLADVNGYLENISMAINSIGTAVKSSDYPKLMDSAVDLQMAEAIGYRFSYKGGDPYLLNLNNLFPLYKENLHTASVHYMEASKKGLINDTASASAEIKVADAYYHKAMEPGQKIIEELRKQNISISKNVQDAHGIWFVEGSKVYT
jgi:hypothetical protein